MVGNKNEVPQFVTQGETIKRQCGAAPVYTLNVNQLETLFKCWLWQQSQQASPEQPAPVKYLSRRETAERLHISLVTLDKRCADGTLIRHKIGARYLFDEAEVDAAVSNTRRS